MPASKDQNSLSKYRAKRSSETTPEPFGGTPTSGAQRFVVQHHAARRVHFDFRLEWDGVLKSWAVPKGPSPNPQDKRLAIRTEDHPIDYVDFEGRIPDGNYGAGAVIVWDRGIWLPLNDIDEGFDSGKLLFELRGYKLRGKWTLVKTKRDEKDWLLIKERDAYTADTGFESLPADSVFSGLTVEQLKAQKNISNNIRTKLKKLGATQGQIRSRRIKPMLAQQSKPFSAPGWWFEIKYDGYRLLAEKNNQKVILYSRNGHDLTHSFPEIEQSIGRLPYDKFIMDGEAIVHDDRGLPSFSLLQKRGRLTKTRDIQRATLLLPATFYAFDLLFFATFDVRSLPLTDRKGLLKQLLPTVGALRYSDHIEEDGELMFSQIKDMNVEGIVAKLSTSAYTSGRSGNWLKISVEKSDDFVVTGYTQKSKTSFGALLLAQYIDGELTYTGRVGSGFSNASLQTIKEKLDALKEAKPPANSPQDKNLCWVKPVYVATVKFKQITPDGLLRAPVFVGLRQDKTPLECQRDYLGHELPEQSTIDDTKHEKTTHFTNLTKVFWPEEGYSKGDLIGYYRSVSTWMLPYLKDRPVVLTRYPDGIEGKSFYQKDAPGFAPDWIRKEKLWSGHAEREISYFVIDDLESLLYVINMGTIPIHMWSSRTRTLERPDWCILDLDPKQAKFEAVVKIAKAIHTLCRSIELPHYIKTSGSTGLHILIPLGAAYTYEQSRILGEVLARIVVQQLPEIATIVRSPSNRGDKVYVDYLQNRHGQTIVAPFSVRPLPGAPVSTPLNWKELSNRNNNQKFTLKNTKRRMGRLKSDPMAKVIDSSIELETTLDRLQASMLDSY
ncbi:MAG: DNA ligase D [Arenicellales bacterium]|nr:DNA ligase D [Arenicellales bacterium]